MNKCDNNGYIIGEINHGICSGNALICGIICLVGAIIILYNVDYRINSVIVNFIGLGFFLVFIIEIIPLKIDYIPNAEIGFYFSIIGSILIFFDIINILVSKEK